ncbi:hypothetical protein Tco_1154517 [Tanacetum coccineum]
MHNNIMAAGSKDRPPMLGQKIFIVRSSREHSAVTAAHEEAETIPQHDQIRTNYYFQAERKLKKEGYFLDFDFCPNGEETVTLEKESRSKLDKDKVKPYDYTYQNSLYETFKPPSKTYLDQLERAKEKIGKTMW